MRAKSIEAWFRINDEGLVGPFQLDVYNILYAHGPLTAGEAWHVYKNQYPTTTRGRNEIAKRIYELTQFGVVVEIGERQCPVTGFNAATWDVTDKLPETKLKERKPSYKELEERLAIRESQLRRAISKIRELEA